MSKPQSKTEPQWTRVGKGIYKTKNKGGTVRYQVRVADATNSANKVKLTVDSLDEAQRRVREAARIRKDGKNVKDVWDAEKGPGGKRRKRVPIETFFEDYLKDCKARKDIGDKKLPSKGGPGSGLRSTKSYRSRCRVLARYLEKLEVGHLDDLTPEKFVALRDEMAHETGYAEKTQASLLGHLMVIIKTRKKHEFPPGFPDEHSRVKAVPPAEPLTPPDDPSKWGGHEFDAFPALPLLDAFRLAEDLAPPRRLVVYLTALMGLRPGEIFGLQLGEISYSADRVWLNIKTSRGDKQKNYVKTKHSNRILPVPPVLQDALVGYCTEFHDWDPLSSSKPDKPDALLIVGPYGVPEAPQTCGGAIRGALKRLGMTKEQLGGTVTLQHLRRTCLSYIQNAQDLTPDAIEAVNPDEDGPDGLKDYGTTERRFILLGMRVSPKSASKYAGHSEQGESPDREAAPVTLAHYNRRVLKGDPLSNVADWISLIVKLEKRDELSAAGEEPDWSIPVATKEPFLTDGDDGWVAYHRFADENGLTSKQIEVQIEKPIWLQKVIRGAVPSRLVLALDHQPASGPRLRLAMRLEHLEMLCTYLATVRPGDLCSRLGFEKPCYRAGDFTKYMVNAGLLTPAESPYSSPEDRFHPEEVERAYQALVVKPFLEQLRRGGAQPPATLGRELKDEPIFRSRWGGVLPPDKRREQVERCLEGLKVEGLVEKIRNGSWKITDQGRTHLDDPNIDQALQDAADQVAVDAQAAADAVEGISNE